MPVAQADRQHGRDPCDFQQLFFHTMKNSITFRLVGDSGQLVGELQVAEKAVKKMADAIAKSGREANKSFGSTRRGVESISRQLQFLQATALKAFGGLAAIGKVKQIAGMADQWAQVSGRLKCSAKWLRWAARRPRH